MSGEASGTPLEISNNGDGTLKIYWEDRGDTGVAYNIYEGDLGRIYDHTSIACLTSGTDNGDGYRYDDITPSSENRYYLVTQSSETEEGTSGYDSGGFERDSLLNTCGVLP